MHEFDRATAVRRRTVDDDGHAVHDVEVDAGWSIGDKPNGGYLLATVARAAADAAAAIEGPDHPHALAATAAYAAPPKPGPAEVRSEVLRRGRGTSQVRARLVQDGAVRVDATLTLGRLRPDATLVGRRPPRVPDVPRERRTPADGWRRPPADHGAGRHPTRPGDGRLHGRPALRRRRAAGPAAVRRRPGARPARAPLRRRRAAACAVRRRRHRRLGAHHVAHRLRAGAAGRRAPRRAPAGGPHRGGHGRRGVRCGTAAAGSSPRPPSWRASARPGRRRPDPPQRAADQAAHSAA